MREGFICSTEILKVSVHPGGEGLLDQLNSQPQAHTARAVHITADQETEAK